MSDKQLPDSPYQYEIEFDDGTDEPHYYFANSIDTDNPAVLKFDPLYELAKDVEREIEDQTVLIPYIRVVRIVRRRKTD